MGHLPRLFSAAMTCLLSPHTSVVSAATNTLKVNNNNNNNNKQADSGSLVQFQML